MKLFTYVLAADEDSLEAALSNCLELPINYHMWAECAPALPAKVYNAKYNKLHLTSQI